VKKFFIYFLLVVNAFLISYAYGLNSIRVQVVDHSLPPLKTPAVTKPSGAKSTTGKAKPDTAPGAKGKHSPTTHSKKTKTTAEDKKTHAAAKAASKDAQ
jgi:hypothetical protein